MSIQFNDTTTRKGLVQFYEKETDREFGEIGNNASRLKDFCADVNLALDDLFYIAAEASAGGQAGDTRHLQYPIVRLDIESAKSKYIVLQDEDDNFILDYHEVVFITAGGERIKLEKYNPQDDDEGKIKFIEGAETGTPSKYVLIGGGIALDALPDFDLVNGIELHVNVEPFYFQSTDTDTYAGIPGSLHDYLFIHPAEAHARRKGTKNWARLDKKKMEIEAKIKNIFVKTTRDERPRLRPARQNNR